MLRSILLFQVNALDVFLTTMNTALEDFDQQKQITDLVALLEPYEFGVRIFLLQFSHSACIHSFRWFCHLFSIPFNNFMHAYSSLFRMDSMKRSTECQRRKLYQSTYTSQ